MAGYLKSYAQLKGVYIAVVAPEIGFSTEIAVLMPKALLDEVPERNPLNVPASVTRAMAATIPLKPQQTGRSPMLVARGTGRLAPAVHIKVRAT